MQQADEYFTKCTECSIRLLANREHSHLELQQKLLVRGFEAALIERVLTKLAAENMQSDKRYAQALVRMRLVKGYGPIYIRNRLQSKGVSDLIIEAVLDFNNPCWQKALTRVILKKYGEAKPGNYQQQVKQMNFLTHRGFTHGQIRHYYDYQKNEDQ